MRAYSGAVLRVHHAGLCHVHTARSADVFHWRNLVNTHVKFVITAVLGCIVGSLVTAQIVRGQAGTPLEGSLSHISFVVNDVDKTMNAFAGVFGGQVRPAQTYRDVPWGPEFPGKMMHGKIGQLRI